MRRVPWTRQPPYPVGIDWSNPLTRGLESIMLGSNTTFNPTGVVWTKNGVETKSVSKLGVGLVRNTSNCQYYPLKTANGGSNDWTIAGIFIPLATFVNAQMPIGVVDTVGTAPNDRSIRASSGSWSGYLYDGTAKIAVSSKAFAVGVPDTIVVSANGTTMTCGVAGVPEVSTGISNNGYTGYSAAKFVLGDASSGTGSTSVAMPIVVRATRAWSYSERQSFLNNPWQIFEPYTVFDNIPFPIVSGPTSYTLIASGGSYTATGSTAILNRNRKLTANGASYTVTGGTAALLRSKRLTLQGGSYNLTGASATLLRSKRITAQGGSYTLLGSSASIFKSRVLLASGGSYVLNGQQITITYTPTAGAYTLTALGGSYTITGSSAVLKRNRSLTAQGGSYALSGASSIIYRSRNLIAQGGSYTTTGSVATLHHNKLLIASGGVYSVAGSQASLLRSKLLTAQGGSYTVTGQQANLSRNRILQALGGAYLISGGSVVIQRSGMVWPSPDQVLLGVQYGPTGADYVGTMDVFGIKYDIVTGNLIKPISDKVVMTL